MAVDEETRQYLDNMMKQINEQFDRILDSLSSMRQYTDNTKGHFLYGLRENLTLSQRLTKVENELRKR
jgi:hypothetical protein